MTSSSPSGRKGHALLIDCRSLDYQAVPVGGDDVRIVVADSKVERGLVDPVHRRRLNASGRWRCSGGCLVSAPCATTPEQLAEHADVLEGDARRARHVVSERDRCLRSVAALRVGDVARSAG